MNPASLGHQLFERWLIATYGESTRSPGRPRYEGLRETRRLIAAELKQISSRLTPPKQAIGLYHWLASAQDGSRTKPRQHIRVAIERVTGGFVPSGSWDQPYVELPEGFDQDTISTELNGVLVGGSAG